MTTDKKQGLELLREPFLPNQISKLPKPSKQQTEEVKADYTKGIRCAICDGWHHPKVVHLDYVGHAALTDRLLDCDANWNWEPLSLDANGVPTIDNVGGMWIKLTVCGVTRLGYGDAEGKAGGNAVKERIGDALRNAAMRFGAALDLWHNGDLHIDEDNIQPAKLSPAPNLLPPPLTNEELKGALLAIAETTDNETLKGIYSSAYKRANAHQKTQLYDCYGLQKTSLESSLRVA